MYAWNRRTSEYTVAIFDNATDHVKNVNLPELESILSEFEPMNYLDYTPVQLHELLRTRVTRHYSVRWFENKYTFILEQKRLAETN
jgi:hypothetical protein